MLSEPPTFGMIVLRRRPMRVRRQACHDFLPRRNPHEAHDLRNMIADGKVGQAKLATDFLIGKAGRQQIKNIALPVRQRTHAGPRPPCIVLPHIGQRHRGRPMDDPHVQVAAWRKIRVHLRKRRADGVEKRRGVPLDDKIHDRSRQLGRQRPGRGFQPAISRTTPPVPKALTMDVSQRPAGRRLLHAHGREIKSGAVFLVSMNWQMANERLRMASQFCQWLFWTGEWQDGQTPITVEGGMPVANDGPGYYSLRIVAGPMQSRSPDDRRFSSDPATHNRAHACFDPHWKFA